MGIRRVLLAIALLAVATSAFSVTLGIAYENKQMYVPGSDVHIKLTIRNDTADTYRFKLAQNRLFNVDLDVRSLNNTALQPARQFTTERTSNQLLFYRDVALEPGEEFSFVENLGDYVDLLDSGIFVVQGRFYPDMLEGDAVLVSDNTLSLTVQPDLRGEEMVQARIDEQTGELIARQPLPPDEVVGYALSGLQTGSWNRFFLYVDAEGLLLSNPGRERSYLRLTETGRRDRLTQFRDELEQQLEDPQLSAIPSAFEMVRTTHDGREATVIMDLAFDFVTFSEIKRYTYFLRSRNGVWYIYDYAVTNLTTE